MRLQGAAEIPSGDVGLAILGPLRELDEVAYLRFASVYQAFDTLEDFESACKWYARLFREAPGDASVRGSSGQLRAPSRSFSSGDAPPTHSSGGRSSDRATSATTSGASPERIPTVHPSFLKIPPKYASALPCGPLLGLG